MGICTTTGTVAKTAAAYASLAKALGLAGLALDAG
jgi:hypothetical protein